MRNIDIIWNSLMGGPDCVNVHSSNHPGVVEIIAPVGSQGSDITNEGLKLQTIGGQ